MSRDDADSGSGQPSNVQMAATEESSVAPPVLVNNVETMANVPAIIARGAGLVQIGRHDGIPRNDRVHGDRCRASVQASRNWPWARHFERSSTGQVAAWRPSSASWPYSSVFPMPCSLMGQLDTELSYEAMSAAGSGLGSAGFIVVAERHASGQRRRRSLAIPGGRVVRSVHAVQAGWCEIARLLAGMARGEAGAEDLDHREGKARNHHRRFHMQPGSATSDCRWKPAGHVCRTDERPSGIGRLCTRASADIGTRQA